MTLQQLLTLATATLAEVPHHPAVTPELCAAICWHESTGDPLAKGDWDKKKQKHLAIGLAQFHLATWDRFAMRPCRAHSRQPVIIDRTCPGCSMVALVRELNYVCRSSRVAKSKPDILLTGMIHYHNSGSDTPKRTAYVQRVKRTMQSFPSYQPPKSFVRKSTRRPTTPAKPLPIGGAASK